MREVDSERDEDESYGRVETVSLVLTREDVVRVVLHGCGPGHPLWFGFGVGAEEETDEDEDGREDSRGPFSGQAPGLVFRVLGEVGEEDTEETEHAECTCWESIRNGKLNESCHLQSLLM